MWALVEEEEIKQILTRPKALLIGDVNYPQNIFMLWSSDELEAIGIYEVVADDSNLKDASYYFNGNQKFVFAKGVVTASYGKATPMQLDPSTDPDGRVTPGIRPNHLAIIDVEAYGLLLPSDWMVVKATETGGSVAEDWTAYRAAVRSTAESMRSKINAVKTTPALQALYEYNNAEPPVRPLGQWPQSPDNSV
tara:strand:+ start:1143 stop:1721 length:579 start_codon:yes stop_codon:yes gene_type:complete